MKNNKIEKKGLLAEIIQKIVECEEYQKKDPDVSAEARIKAMENDPCDDGTYYVNVTLKDALPEEITTLAERKKHVEMRKELPLISDMDSFFSAGCIMTVTLQKDGTPSYDVQAAGSFSEMVGTLKAGYFDSSCTVSPFYPKKTILSDSFVESDIKTASANGKSKIMYGLARIDKTKVEEWLEKHYTKQAYDLDKWEFNNFKDAAYVDMTKTTAFEQNVNASFKNAETMNSVTMLASKSKLPNYNLQRQFGVYDMGYYVVSTLEEIKKTDDAQARRKYEIYSQGVFKDYLEGKYDSYLANGGSADWATWSDCQGQYLAIKALLAEDPTFDISAVRGNLKAYETTADLYANSQFETIEKNWKRTTPVFTYSSPAGITFENSPRSAAQAQATSIVNSQLVDAPYVHVKPRGSSKIEYDESPTYRFAVAVPAQEPGENEKAERSIRLSDSSYYEMVKGFFKSINKIDIYRDHIKLDNFEYEYTDVPIELGANDSLPYRNDVTGESGIFVIPEKHYYNVSERLLFKADDLDSRIIQATLTFNLIPKKLVKTVKFIQESNWTKLDPAKEHLKSAKDEHQEDAVRICIDTIPYDPWEKMIEKLNKLYGKWNRLAPDLDGNFEIPPIEIDDPEDLENVICTNCKKPMKDCVCKRPKLCEKLHTIDLFGNEAFEDEDLGLFNASTSIFDKDGNKMTMPQIAMSFYRSLHPLEDNVSIEDFIVRSEKAEEILKTQFSTLCLTTSYALDDSAISQFDIFNYKKFIKEYDSALGYDVHTMVKSFFGKKLQIGLMDGYLYVPTGFDISLDFDKSSRTFIIDGLEKSKVDAHIEDLTTLDGFKTALYKLDKKASLDKHSVNLKKYMLFPSTPNVDEIISGSFGNVCDTIDEFEESFYYKPKFTNLKSIIDSSESPVISLRFDIYLKKPVICSNPRCQYVHQENEDSKGGCGLDVFFRTPFILSMGSFDFYCELKKKLARMKINKLRKRIREYDETSSETRKLACNIDHSIKIIDEVKNEAMNRLYSFGASYKSVIDKLPRDPISANGLSVICQAAKNAKLRSVAEDYNDIFMHTAGMLYPLSDDRCNFEDKSFNNVLVDSSTCAKQVTDFYEEVREKSANFSMCSVKHSNYINDKNKFKLLKRGMTEEFMSQLERGFTTAVIERLTNHQIFENAGQLGLTDDEDVRKAARLITGGDITGVKAFIEEHKTELENANTDFSKKFLAVKDDLINLSELTELNAEARSMAVSLSNAAKKELNPSQILIGKSMKTQTSSDVVAKDITKTVSDYAKLDKKTDNENQYAKDAQKELENPSRPYTSAELLLLKNVAEDAPTDKTKSVSAMKAATHLQPGDVETLVKTCIGNGDVDASQDMTGKMDVEEQSKEQAAVDDAFVDLEKFLAEKAALYKSLTDETISFE